jgi:hypothetical protein
MRQQSNELLISGGSIAATAVPVVSTQNAQYTSVAATDTHTYSVAFIGTHDGRIVKVVVESKEKAVAYATIEIESGRAILQDMDFDISSEYLYVMNEQSVSERCV